MFASTTSNTVSAWPAFNRLRAIGAAHVAQPDEGNVHFRLIVVLTLVETASSSNHRDVTVFVWV